MSVEIYSTKKNPAMYKHRNTYMHRNSMHIEGHNTIDWNISWVYVIESIPFSFTIAPFIICLPDAYNTIRI